MSVRKKGMNPLALVLLLSGLFFIVFLIVSAALFNWRGASEDDGETASAMFGSRKGAVGVIEIRGVIMDSKDAVKKIKKMAKRKRVKALVIRIDSPGGSVGPSQEIFEAVKELEKPVVSSMGSVAASGGYYIAVGTDEIFANPGTLTGSIGVVMQFMNLQELYKWAKVKRYAITTGRFKDSGADYRALRDDERELFQDMADDILDQFKEAVAAGRNMPMDKLSPVADGRVFTGRQAYELGLVDNLGTLQAAINKAALLGKIEGEPDVVYPEKKSRRWLDIVLDEAEDEYDSRAASGSILERLVRRVIFGEAPAGVPVFRPGVYWLWNGAVDGAH